MPKAKEGLVVIPPDRIRHHDAVIDLCAKVFSAGKGYYAFRDYCQAGYVDHSNYDWQASQVGMIGQRVVTHWGVWGYDMRVGCASLRVGGVGLVATDGDFRKRGLMAQTLPYSFTAMRELGYDVSLLSGIKDFYNHFGYTRAFSFTRYDVNLADMPTDRPTPMPRKFALVFRDDIARLYNRQNAGLTGTAIRPTYPRCKNPGQWTGYLWNDADGKLAGYVVVGPEPGQPGWLCHIDSAGDARQILRVLAHLARKENRDTVVFHMLHRDSQLARTLRRGNCREELRHERAAGRIIRIINLASCLRKIAPELSARLKRSTLANWSGRLLIADSRESAVLDIARGKVALSKAASANHAIRGGDEIAQLLIGTDNPLEVVERGDMKLTGQASTLVQALFPAQNPMLSPWDSF
jgi:hypothetical protein